MTNDELSMELADCGSPEGLAKIIHAHIPLKDDGSVNLRAIAKAVGIKEIKPSKSTAYEGLLITDASKSKGAILYNSNSNTFRKRFTVAHELGHFLLPFHNKNAECASSDMTVSDGKNTNLKKEAEANRFAIELLAPQQQIKDQLKSQREPDIQQLLDLHKQFKISKEAAARRYIEFSDHVVAIIFGKEALIRYVLRVEDFPYINLKTSDNVPAHITEQVSGKNAGDIIDWYSVDPEYFLSKPDMAEGKELFCQTLVQNKGFHISLLSLEDE